MSAPTISLEDFEKQLKAHDWFYAMSDDGAVYHRGSVDRSRLRVIARAGGLEYQALFNMIEAKHFNTKDFPRYKPTFDI